jgi:hypothetical protein
VVDLKVRTACSCNRDIEFQNQNQNKHRAFAPDPQLHLLNGWAPSLLTRRTLTRQAPLPSTEAACQIFQASLLLFSYGYVSCSPMLA